MRTCHVLALSVALAEKYSNIYEYQEVVKNESRPARARGLKHSEIYRCIKTTGRAPRGRVD